MSIRKRYISLSVNPFDSWRLFFYGFLLTTFFTRAITKDTSFAFFLGFWGSLGVVSLIALSSISIITRVRNDITFWSLERVVRIKNVKSINTWWCYEFGPYTAEYNASDTDGKKRGHINRLNCFVEFLSSDDNAYIYEQIHLGSKFPNNHPYSIEKRANENRLVKVWDIDKCISKLELNHLLNT